MNVKLSVAAVARAAKTKAPLAGLAWREHNAPVIVPVRLLSMAIKGRDTASQVHVKLDADLETPRTLVISGAQGGRKWTHTLKLVSMRDARAKLWKWSEGERRRRAWKVSPAEAKADARRAKLIAEARRRLERHRMHSVIRRPDCPILNAVRRGERDYTNERLREWAEGREMRRRVAQIAAQFLRDPGPTAGRWQRVATALKVAGLGDVIYGYKKLHARRGTWAVNPESYLKHLYRDVRSTGGDTFRSMPYDWADECQECREWRNERLLRYVEWRAKEVALMQDVADLERGVKYESAMLEAEREANCEIC